MFLSKAVLNLYKDTLFTVNHFPKILDSKMLLPNFNPVREYGEFGSGNPVRDYEKVLVSPCREALCVCVGRNPTL